MDGEKPSIHTIEQAVSPEVARKALFEECAKKLEEEALSLQEKRYGQREIQIWESGADMRRFNLDYLPFHNSWHVREMVEATELILCAMREGGVPISEKDVWLGRIVAAFHDTVQNWREEKQDNGMTKRQRMIGDNETASAHELAEHMRRTNEEAGAEVFSEHDIEIGNEAIKATVPGFSPECSTVVQPNLTDESEPLVRAIALADLATAGMAGGVRYVDGGNRLFREENLDAVGADTNSMSDEQKESLIRRMLAWKRFQPKFATGRRDLFESEIASLPERAKIELRQLFCKFNDSIEVAQKDADKLVEVVESQDSVDEKFTKALELMGYTIDERSNGKKIIYP